jgi:glycosyltransferase involved in cell wall biosynthesis
MTILFITDIPAPYRVEMYNTLAESLLKMEVWYFQKESKTRPWKFDAAGLKHKFWVASGLYFLLGRYNLFVNPHLVMRLLLKQPKHIILAAGWNDFDVICIVVLKRLGLLRGRIGFWSEANYLTLGAQKDNLLKFWIRRFVYNTCDGFQLISGEMTRRTLALWKVRESKEIMFPNTIQEAVHTTGLMTRRKEVTSPMPTILIVARLTEKLKGIINFLEALSDDQLKHIKLLLAGDGEDRKKIEDLIESRELQDHVKLLGNLSETEMAEVYSKADAFCLPSFSDASPLSVIEALQWGLPLFISERCGNHFEAVVSGVNGLTFDPMKANDIRISFNEFILMKSNWVQMGKNSNKIFKDVFSKNTVLTNFIKHINSDCN